MLRHIKSMTKEDFKATGEKISTFKIRFTDMGPILHAWQIGKQWKQ